MSTYETSAIQELTDSELDAETGGVMPSRDFIVCGEHGSEQDRVRNTGRGSVLLRLPVWWSALRSVALGHDRARLAPTTWTADQPWRLGSGWWPVGPADGCAGEGGEGETNAVGGGEHGAGGPAGADFYGRREVGRARLLPAVAGGMEWFWQLHGIANGYERERTTALQALAVAWSKRAK